ncbi:MAG: M28 family peptidase [Bacteroidota bacterium]|nr:M28 family peptidase [Bacteroidota bacterium]
MKIFITGIICFGSLTAFSQNINTLINAKETERVEKILSSDEMQGRRVFTAGIEKAATFIEGEFKKAGLQPLGNAHSYRQEFEMVKPQLVSLQASIDGAPINENNIVIASAKATISGTEKDQWSVIKIDKKENPFIVAMKAMETKGNKLVLVDTSLSKMFPRFKYFSRQLFSTAPDVVFVLTSKDHFNSFSINATQSLTTQKLANIVGLLPGRLKKNEYVIFSGHYDHLGIGKAVNNDSIYNGANDDAAGTTAVILLANYFKAMHNNQRSIVFAAFTAEEIGEYGSAYFSHQFNPDQVKAMFNIEMIGTESKWGKNSAYITGFEKTDMGTILQKNLKGSAFQFYPDPYPDQQLFYRSDNTTLAKQGVPAHTISTSKMDSEPNYHKPSDEIATLNMSNMAEIIKAIAISSSSIISGKDTPTRVDTSDLK